jgi:outer membrane murein-binding lipoprotein Lpp
MTERITTWFKFARLVMLLALTPLSTSGLAQETASGTERSLSASLGESSDSVRELREQVRELQAAVAAMRSDWQTARSETAGLRREIDEIRAASGSQNAVLRNAMVSSGTSEASAEREASRNDKLNQESDQKRDQERDRKRTEHAATLEEEYQLLSGKVDDQYQTKVESASKYRLRVSGIVLMNLISNQGVVDNIDLPTLTYARPSGNSGGSFAATLRQSEIGLETFGPNIAGAKIKADLQLDLAGGFTTVPNGINSGLVRLRTGTLRMDWANTSVVGGQDSIFFSPNSPTSFASLAIPALSYAGNLWGWVPQIRVEHKIATGEDSSLIFQGGILDPVSGESPGSRYYRQGGPGEASRQPAYASRIGWTRNIFNQPLRIGAGGYYSRQNYGFQRNVDAWAGMADFDLPLSHHFSLSGEVYRGRGLGGLYGGIGRSVLFSGDPASASTAIQALNTVGGWAQTKFRPTNKLEFNAAVGTDNPYASDLKYFLYPQAYGNPSLARNQGGFVNIIYRPRSDLLFSAEYRRLRTYSLTDGRDSAGHLNLSMGVLF